jgi:uroporphyrinogen-III synthase
VVVRGPKPATVLHSRKVRIDRAASNPFTTHEVLAAMHGAPLRGKRVVVQRYGETNRELQAELESEGADVIEIVTYRWGLPEDTTPLLRLIGALGRDDRPRGVHQRVAGAQPFHRRAMRRQRGVA